MLAMKCQPEDKMVIYNTYNIYSEGKRATKMKYHGYNYQSRKSFMIVLCVLVDIKCIPGKIVFEIHSLYHKSYFKR